LFAAYCLPALRQQPDPDFLCLILVGANMPPLWKDRLRDLCASVPALRLVEAEPQHHYSGIKKAFQSVAEKDHTHRTTFRFDDDDAVDDGFVARLKTLAPRVAMIGGADNPAAIAHNLGFFLERSGEKPRIYPTCERTPLSVGTAMIAPVSYRENIYRYDHRQLPQFVNTYCDTQTYAYVRTVHQDNKSNPHRTGTRREMPNREIDRILRAGFGRKLGQFKHIDP